MSGRGRKRHLTDDEHKLWKTVTKAVAPLRAQPREPEVVEKPPSTPAPKRAKPAPGHGVPRPIIAPPAPSAPEPTPLGRKLKQRVARGREPIDARLDLHGMTQSEAHAALARFLRASSSKGAKLVLVITGKSGVLRRQAPLWLALPDFREHVIGFEEAHVAHGGEGALYVRVRRPRSRDAD